MTSKEKIICLKYQEGHTICFDKVFNNGSGQLLGIGIIPINETACTTRESNVTYNALHCKLGHPNEQVTKATAKQLGLKVADPLPDYLCLNCGLCKQKVNKIPKFNPKIAIQKGERIFMDISLVNQTSFGGAKYWVMIQDE